MEKGNPETKFTSLRPLGHVEKYSSTRSHLRIYNNVGLTARYKRPLGAGVKSALFHALSRLISNHPILSAVPLAVETANPYFARLPKISLDEAVTFVQKDVHSSTPDSGEILDRTVEEQHNCPFHFDPHRPLPFWRLCVLENNNEPTNFTLVFIFHHALMDTRSALSFHEELEENMIRFHRFPHKIESKSIIETPSCALIPPMEDLYPLPISQDFLRSQGSYTEPSSDVWTASPQFTPAKTRFSSLWLPEADTKMLTALSKRENSSVTAALQTLIAICLFSVLPSKFKSLQADCAVSLRRFLPQPVTTSTMGCYVGSISTMYSRTPLFDWNEARRAKEAIDHAMAQKGGDLSVGYLRFVPNQHHWMIQKLGRKRMAAFELSNIGVGSSSSENSCFGIEGMLFSQSASACSAAIKISAVTGRDGKLALGFTWQEGVVDGGMIKQLQRAFRAHVEELAASK